VTSFGVLDYQSHYPSKKLVSAFICGELLQVNRLTEMTQLSAELLLASMLAVRLKHPDKLFNNNLYIQ